MKIVAGILLFLAALILNVNSVMQKTPDTKPRASAPTPTITNSPTDTPTPTATPIPVVITATPVPVIVSPAPTPIPQQANDINGTVNEYRKTNGRGALATNGDLCRIASTRVADQARAGSLDNHAGFQGQAASQKEFLHVGEILQYRNPPESNHWLVFTGWAGSGEHNAMLLDPSWTHGCGAVSGTFAVFIFGRK
jgi:uncharacterized protein YkwD